MADVYTLRVRRTHGARAFPFDRVYLVQYNDRQVIQDLFRYAMVLPVVGALLLLLKKAAPEITLFRPHERDDGKSMPQPLKEGEWREFAETGQWIMVVPILSRYFVKEIEAHPRYLVAREWAIQRDMPRKRSKPVSDPFTDLSYLKTPTENIRPICAACPRFIFHQNGDCQIGQVVCFDNLPMGGLDYFQEGLDAPEADYAPYGGDEEPVIRDH